ncbi:MAG: DUF2281 domain-containing protein [Fimbriimonas sp.]
MYETTRSETVGSDGMIHIAVPELTPGQVVEVILRDTPPRKKFREAGRLAGKIVIADDFDAPLEEMEPYS